MIRYTATFLTLAATLVFTTAALANDEDKAACEDLVEGAECLRHNGDDGICVYDDSDPDVLTCEDENWSGGDDSGGVSCATGRSPASGAPILALLGLGVLGLVTRRVRV